MILLLAALAVPVIAGNPSFEIAPKPGPDAESTLATDTISSGEELVITAEVVDPSGISSLSCIS